MQQNLCDEYRTSRLCYIIESALEYFISIMVTGAYLARVTSSLGFSDSLTGILSSFVSLGCVFQLGAIGLFRNTRLVKRPILRLHILNQTLFALVWLTPVLPLTSGQKSFVFLVCFCGAFIISNLIVPPKVNWLMGLIEDRSRGIFTAHKEIVSLLGGMLFTFLTGTIIDHLDTTGNVRLSFIFGSAALFALMLLHTLSLLPVKEKPSVSAASGGDLRSLLSNRRYVRIVPVILIWNIANSCATPFFGAYQIKELGFSMTFISVLSILYSLVRVSVSPLLGRYADRTSFSRMVLLCFGLSAAGSFVSCFTVPSNGKILYTITHCLNALAMAGINSSLTNLVYDCVQGDNRRSALAISSALSGVCGFGTTCLMSPIVAYIQSQGNQFWGLHLYPTQFASAIAFSIMLMLIAYLHFVVIRSETITQ